MVEKQIENLQTEVRKRDEQLEVKRNELIEKENQKIIPKLQFGNPIEDMSPLLNREEF